MRMIARCLRVSVVGVFFCCLVVSGCASQEAAGHAGEGAERSVRTTAKVTDNSPEEARQLLRKDATALYLDVRTTGEYINGHPRNAWNIPVLMRDASSGKMMPNDRFLAVVEANIPRDKLLVVGCRSGGRSALAGRMLVEAGYTRVHNMLGGFGGKMDSNGKVAIEGWASRGFPTESGEGGDRGYGSLADKASRSERK